MAKLKSTLKKPSSDAPASSKRATSGKQGAYFLSLSVENVRCFGPEQTLDLSNGMAKPAPWTIILGLNGTGKTTLLQLLVGTEQITHPSIEAGMPAISSHHYAAVADSLSRSDREGSCVWRVKVGTADSLADDSTSVAECEFEAFEDGVGCVSDSVEALWCCAYGAGRRMGLLPSANLHLTSTRQPSSQIRLICGILRSGFCGWITRQAKRPTCKTVRKLASGR